MASSKRNVAIILATYNGQAYLSEQLQSIAQQTLTDWHVLAGDDGSSDATHSLLLEFAKRYPATVSTGMRKGFPENFMATLLQSEQNTIILPLPTRTMCGMQISWKKHRSLA